MKYQSIEFVNAIQRMAYFFDRPVYELVKTFRGERDLIYSLNIGLLAILLQVERLIDENEISLPPEIVDQAEVCAARLNNLSFANDNWISDQEWESVSRSFNKLNELMNKEKS